MQIKSPAVLPAWLFLMNALTQGLMCNIILMSLHNNKSKSAVMKGASFYRSGGRDGQ